MAGVDMSLYARETRSQKRKNVEELRRRKHLKMFEHTNELEEIRSGSESELDDETSDPTVIDIEDEFNVTSAKRGQKQWITSRLCAALDDAKVSDGKAVHILAAAANALGVDIPNLVINRTSIQRERKKYRELGLATIQADFAEGINSMHSLVVHWDGKLMDALVGPKKVDRIAILVSYNGTSKLLNCTAIEPSTGENFAAAVRESLIKWNLINRIGAMSFDTTSSNTGSKNGATVFLEKYMDRKLIKLPCRHHIYEIILRSVFELNNYGTSGPEVPIFNRFAAAWEHLNHGVFKSGIEDDVVHSKISNEECEIIKQFCHQNLQKEQVRADYKELLQLTLTFLGEHCDGFRLCGSTSHARFMGKAIYSLKIFLFREQFILKPKELISLRSVCLFLVQIYIKVWYGCPNAISAPNQDLQFVKDSITYGEINAEVSATILSKMKNHLWYLTPETTALAFFDPCVSYEEKRNMVSCLQSTEPNVKLLEDRRIPDPTVLHLSSLKDFVSYKTKNFFAVFGLSSTFLQSDPSTWEQIEEYQDALLFCQDLFVVNDTAERGIKFMKDYNRVLTKDENQKQLVLQFVEAYRKKFSSHKKSSLV